MCNIFYLSIENDNFIFVNKLIIRFRSDCFFVDYSVSSFDSQINFVDERFLIRRIKWCTIRKYWHTQTGTFIIEKGHAKIEKSTKYDQIALLWFGGSLLVKLHFLLCVFGCWLTHKKISSIWSFRAYAAEFSLRIVFFLLQMLVCLYAETGQKPFSYATNT